MDSKKSDNKSKNLLSNSKIWNCEKHPGCLISIPCDCKNCIRYNNYLSWKINQSTELSSSNCSDIFEEASEYT